MYAGVPLGFAGAPLGLETLLGVAEPVTRFALPCLSVNKNSWRC